MSILERGFMIDRSDAERSIPRVIVELERLARRLRKGREVAGAEAVEMLLSELPQIRARLQRAPGDRP